jgi:RNA 3'-terminal phosphate cyclase-like protein
MFTWATRVSPAICNRMVVAARAVLNKCLPDIYITTDHKKGGMSGK